MPNTPDFDAIAQQLVPPQFVWLVVDGLLRMWNARGAADAAAIEAELTSLMGTTALPYVKNLKRALRSLDR